MFCHWLSYDLRPRSANSQCFFYWLSYDLRPRSTNSQCFSRGWATIYETDQPIYNVLSLVELRSTTQISQFAMFFLVVELRSTTKVSQIHFLFELRSTIYALTSHTLLLIVLYWRGLMFKTVGMNYDWTGTRIASMFLWRTSCACDLHLVHFNTHK